jgi:hypothetical protein
VPVLRRHHEALSHHLKIWSSAATIHVPLPFLQRGRYQASQAGGVRGLSRHPRQFKLNHVPLRGVAYPEFGNLRLIRSLRKSCRNHTAGIKWGSAFLHRLGSAATDLRWPSNFRITPKSDRIAALRQVTRWDLLDCTAIVFVPAVHWICRYEFPCYKSWHGIFD